MGELRQWTAGTRSATRRCDSLKKAGQALVRMGIAVVHSRAPEPGSSCAQPSKEGKEWPFEGITST